MMVPKRILVVEDSTELQTVMSRVIKNAFPNAELVWETTAESAFDRLIHQKETFDFVISDIYLDGQMTGFDLYKLINLHQLKCRFILMSSMPLRKFIRKTDRLTPYPHSLLPKPFYVKELLNAINGRELIQSR